MGADGSSIADGNNQGAVVGHIGGENRALLVGDDGVDTPGSSQDVELHTCTHSGSYCQDMAAAR